MRSWSIRWKMTASYIAAMAVILVVFGAMMTTMMVRQLHQEMDSHLREEAREFAEEIRGLQSFEQMSALFISRYSDHSGFSYQLSDERNEIISGSPWLRSHRLLSAFPANDKARDSIKDIELGKLGVHRVLSRTIKTPAGRVIMHVVVPYLQYYHDLRNFVNILIVSGCVALVTACAGGLVIARRALTPLERVILAAERISTENLNVAIQVDNPKDELGRLATTLNDTFRRLHESVDRMCRFTADAAHELRTPLTVLRTRLEVALRLPPNSDDHRDSYQVAISQADRLKKVIDQLLLLSRHDAGVCTEQFDEVELNPLIADVVEILRATARDKEIELTVSVEPECTVWGDDISLSRVFFNLIDNAIKYSPSKSQIDIRGTSSDGLIRISVSDHGPGIPAEHLPRLFNRFYRADPARNDQTGGAGLGLAICRSIIETHGGEITVISHIGEGTTFSVELPLNVPLSMVATAAKRNKTIAAPSQIGQLHVDGGTNAP